MGVEGAARQSTLVIATRGSALALAQANLIKGACEAAFPSGSFELKIIRTTGDRMQSISLAQSSGSLPKGLFTKELEVALLKNEADLAVHSLKDLPTELPAGLQLGAVGRRADVRDVLIYRGTEVAAAEGRKYRAGLTVEGLPTGATLATSSTRRGSQLLAIRPDLKIVEIRGNVATRIRKLVELEELDGTILAAAGLSRLGLEIRPDGEFVGTELPGGLLASVLSVETMLPCVGQGALGIEVRAGDAQVLECCARLDDRETHCCVLAERSFLRAMGGGCQSPVGALGEMIAGRLRLRAVVFQGSHLKRRDILGAPEEAERIGEELAASLRLQNV
jgi:hydroxymethylbilane synthase